MSQTGAAKPTIVLVHGAWADATSWNGVVPPLQAAGYTVMSPPNELRGLANDAGVVATFLKSISGPIVLVGHSYGGAVISVASAGNANVKALVYIDAFIPDEGESLASLLAAGPPPPPDLFVPIPFTTRTGADDVDLYFNTKYYAPVFASDVPAPAAALMAVAQRPLTQSALIGKTPATLGWRTIPSWYVVGDLDLVIPPAIQLSMAQRAKSTISHVPGSHPSMIVHSEATVAAIEAAGAAIETTLAATAST